MRRSTQNLGLDSLGACSILNRDLCKGYAPVGCLRVPLLNAYHFLTGVSLIKYYENSDIHLTFGDKFDSVIFLYALYEDGSEVPSTLLCVDESVFKSYGLSEDITAVSPPTFGQFARFKTEEFLENNRDIDQESAIENIAFFKLSASRFVNYLAQRMNDPDFKDIFSPPPAMIASLPSDPELSTTDNNDSNPNDGQMLVDQRADASSSKKKKDKDKSAKKKRDLEINAAYENHVTPRKRGATDFYKPPLDEPKLQKPLVIIDMNGFEMGEDEDKGKDPKISKSKSKSKKKETKKKETKKTKSSHVDDKPKPTPRKSKSVAPKTAGPTPSMAVNTTTPMVSQNSTIHSNMSVSVQKNKDDREEREYLRKQTLLDLDVDNQRASSYFDLAERANRMA